LSTPVSCSGQAGALLASTGSVDTTGNYVFAVPAHAAGASAGKTSVFWTTANGFDTMYSIWNPASQAQPLLATFQLGNGRTYLYPVTVPALGTAMIDVKEIAEMGVPDSNGNTLPLSVTQGRVSFSAASGKPTDPMNVVIGGGIYNPAKAVCGNTCECCDGCTSFQITPNPVVTSVGVLTYLYVQCPWTTGGVYDYTQSSNWTSGNSSVVVFDSPGLASPQDPGSTTVAAQMPSVPMSQGQICTEGSLPPCAYGAPAVGGGITVAPACPTTATIVSTTQVPLQAGLQNNFPTYLTGFGAVMLIGLGPGGPSTYNGATVTEAFSNTTTTCPAGTQFATCSGSGTFTAGPVNNQGNTLQGTPEPSTGNGQFLDEHASGTSSDILAGQGANYSCTVTCTQTYTSCNQTIGTFTLTKTLTHGSINGTSVTSISAAEQ
jgi:hypothetical protein